jgi:hypothetical protein
LRFTVSSEDAGRGAIRAVRCCEWLQLFDHLLMILDHLLCELLHFGILGFLQGKLAKLDFRFVLTEQAAGQELVHY